MVSAGGCLSGKVALVTGGTRGLGVAIAMALADQDADVAISYVASDDKAAAVVADLRSRGVRAVAIKSDQGDLAAAEPLLAGVVDQLGGIDIVVNNAAISILAGVSIIPPTTSRPWSGSGPLTLAG